MTCNKDDEHIEGKKEDQQWPKKKERIEKTSKNLKN